MVSDAQVRGTIIEWRPDASADLRRLTSELNGAIDAAEEGGANWPLVIHLPSAEASDAFPSGDVSTEDVNRWERTLFRLERSQLVTIAVLDGVVGGAAFDLLVATTVRVASEGAVVRLAVNAGQLWPGMSLFRLARESGVGAARRILFADQLDAPMCAQFNLVNHVAQDLQSAIDSILASLHSIDHSEISRRWALVREGGITLADDVLGLHLAACDRELRRLDALRSGPAEASR